MRYKTISGTASDGGNHLCQLLSFLGTLLTHSSKLETWCTGKMLNFISHVWNDLRAVRAFSSALDQCYLGLILTYFKAWSENYFTGLWKALRDPSVKTEKTRANTVILIPKIVGKEPRWSSNIDMLWRGLTTKESKVSHIWNIRDLQILRVSQLTYLINIVSTASVYLFLLKSKLLVFPSLSSSL